MGNKLAVSYKKVADLVAYANNSRTHSDTQIEQIAKSIVEFGFLNPVIIDSDGGIIAGHCRVMAAKRLGLVDVPCVSAEHLTDAQKRAYVIADNKLALNAGWDDAILKNEMLFLGSVDFNLDLIGFDEKELVNIFNEIAEVEIKSAIQENENYSLTVSTKKKDFDNVINIIASALKDFPDVEIIINE